MIDIPDRPSILYVDDEVDNLTVFHSSFRRQFEVLTTTSPEEALRLMEENEIPVIITDQRMPLCSGVELLERLPEDHATVRIILTGYSDIEIIIEAINNCQIFRYITKPWNQTDLQNTIQQALQKYYLKQTNYRLVDELKAANEKLAQKVEVRTEQLRIQQERSHQLLLNILPEATAEELIRRGKVRPRLHENVSILFMDIKGFTQLTERMDPEDLVEELDYYYKVFDTICGKHGVEKIKTIGDAYLAVCGVPVARQDHAVRAVRASREIFQFIEEEKRQRERIGRPFFELRVGIHSGKVITGVVGHAKFAYDVWGDDVNTAARLESSGEVGRINISESTYQLVKDDYNFIHRGKVKAKNKGALDMYYLEEKEGDSNG